MLKAKGNQVLGKPMEDILAHMLSGGKSLNLPGYRASLLRLKAALGLREVSWQSGIESSFLLFGAILFLGGTLTTGRISQPRELYWLSYDRLFLGFNGLSLPLPWVAVLSDILVKNRVESSGMKIEMNMSPHIERVGDWSSLVTGLLPLRMRRCYPYSKTHIRGAHPKLKDGIPTTR